jgi:hypothetical protein
VAAEALAASSDTRVPGALLASRRPAGNRLSPVAGTAAKRGITLTLMRIEARDC